MCYVYQLITLMMGLFMVLQFNDPDGARWAAIYAVPAIWGAVAVVRPASLRLPVCRWTLLACTAGSLMGIVWFWPDTPQFWSVAVWYETESAREGLGIMLASVALVIILIGSSLSRGRTMRLRPG